MYSFTHNYCVNYVQRDEHKRKKIISSDPDDRFRLISYHDEENNLDAELIEIKISKLMNTLNGLNASDKTILQLKYIEREPVKKIQELLNINASAVKMRLKRARLKLLMANQELVS